MTHGTHVSEARRGPADDTLRRTHRPPDTRLKKHCLGQRTGEKLTLAVRGRAQKPRQREKSFDPSNGSRCWQIFIAVQHVECLRPLARVLPADANGGNSCVSKSLQDWFCCQDCQNCQDCFVAKPMSVSNGTYQSQQSVFFRTLKIIPPKQMV